MSGKNRLQCFTVDEEKAEMFRLKIKGQEISCVEAFRTAAELGFSEKEVGGYANHFHIHLVKCQIGLFGYAPPDKKLIRKKESVDSDLESAVRKHLQGDSLSCENVFHIAEALNISKVEVGCACETLGIKIRNCRFGAF